MKIKFIFILVLLGFIVYCPSLFGGFIWDDEDLVYQNQYVAEFRIDKFFWESAGAGRGKPSSYYRPLQLLNYALIHKFFGFTPFFYHLNSVVLHILAAVLLFLFLKQLLNHWFVPFLTSFFFLIHPIQTESVSYISGVTDPLFAIFMLLSLIFFIKKEEKHFYWLLSLVFFVLSFLAKELGILTLGLVFLTELFFRREKIKEDAGILFAFVIAGVWLLLARLTIFNFVDMASLWQGHPYGQSLFVRLATFFHNFFLYLTLLVYPKELFMERDYTIKIIQNIFNYWTLVFFVFNLLFFGLIWILDKRKIINGKVAAFFWLAFLVSLLPFSGVVLINGVFYEHFLYLPMIFFWGFVSSFFAHFSNKKFFWSMVVLISLLFIGRSYLRQYEWIDNVRFYQQTLKHAPKSIRLINNLGMEWANRGSPTEAIKVYKQGIAIDPSVPNLYHNLANVYLGLNRFSEAEDYYLKAIKADANFYFSYYSLLDLYLKQNQKEKAKEFLEKQALPKLPYNQKLRQFYLFLTSSGKQN